MLRKDVNLNIDWEIVIHVDWRGIKTDRFEY